MNSHNLCLLYLTYPYLLPSSRSAHQFQFELHILFVVWGGPFCHCLLLCFICNRLLLNNGEFSCTAASFTDKTRVVSCLAARARASTWCPVHEVLQNSTWLFAQSKPGTCPAPQLNSSFIALNIGILSWSFTNSPLQFAVSPFPSCWKHCCVIECNFNTKILQSSLFSHH